MTKGRLRGCVRVGEHPRSRDGDAASARTADHRLGGRGGLQVDGAT
jgi:hypothetical protein